MPSYLGEIKASWKMFITFIGKINVISLLFLYYVFLYMSWLLMVVCFLYIKLWSWGYLHLGRPQIESTRVMFIQVFEVDLQLPLGYR